MSSEAPFTKNFRVTDEVKHLFDKEGFFILRSLFSKEEVHCFQSIKIMFIYPNYCQSEVYISIHVGILIPTRIFFVVQKYSNQGVSCRNIQIRVFRAEILVRYRYALPSHARLTIWIGPNQTRLHQNAQLQLKYK